MYIIKASGQKEDFDPLKLCTSIKRSGAPEYLADSICEQLNKEVEPNMSTRNVWRMALSHLSSIDISISARFSLKRGLAMLGPTGFVFEQYVEALMQSYGFETKRGIMMRGASGIEHEIDVWIKAPGVNAIIEAKFRNDHGTKTHVDVVMYAQSRLLDIKEYAEKHSSEEDIPKEVWLITNTKFTDSTIKYAQFKNITLIGWDYPKNGSLEELICAKKMYPISVLPSVSHLELKELSAQHIILLTDILPYSSEDITRMTDIPPEVARKIVKEAKELFEK